MNEDYAIVVGINTYPGLSALDGPCEDASQVMEEWLQKPEYGNVSEERTYSLLTSQFHPPDPKGVADVHPVEEEVNALFRPLVVKGQEEGHIGRRLYIYMAGHGFSDPSNMESAALYAANAEMAFAPHIAGTAYADWFRRNGVFDEIILVMDCCRTVNPMQSIRPPPLPNTNKPGKAAKVRTFYAYGTSWGAVARERLMNGTVRGIFTTALLEAIDNAPPNSKGRVTGQAVKDYIHNVIERVADGVAISPPDIHVNSNHDVSLLVRQKAPVYKVRVLLTPHSGNEWLLVSGGAGNKEVRLDCPNAHVDLTLKSGLYKVLVEGTDRRKLFEVVGTDVEITL